MTDPTASAQQQIRCSSIRPHLVACQGTDFCLHPIVQLRQGAGSGIFDNCDLVYHIMSYHVQVYFWMMHQWHDTQPERPQHSTGLHLCIFLSSKILWPDRSQQRVLKTHRVFYVSALCSMSRSGLSPMAGLLAVVRCRTNHGLSWKWCGWRLLQTCPTQDQFSARGAKGKSCFPNNRGLVSNGFFQDAFPNLPRANV